MNGTRRRARHHIRIQWFVLVAGLSMASIGEALASYAAIDPPQLATFGSTQSIGGYTISVQPKTDDGWDDDRVLLIENQKKNQKIALTFTSAYGRFHLYAPILTNTSTPDIALVTAEGRGSGVTVFSVTVYRVVGSKLVDIYERKISEYDNEDDCLWWYDVDFVRKDGDLESMTLELKAEWPGDHKPDHLSKEFPSEKSIVVSWDPDKGRTAETIDGRLSR